MGLDPGSVEAFVVDARLAARLAAEADAVTGDG